MKMSQGVGVCPKSSPASNSGSNAMLPSQEIVMKKTLEYRETASKTSLHSNRLIIRDH